jgi:acyl phosphate:glycerol-3-phosphate acyltransferase
LAAAGLAPIFAVFFLGLDARTLVVAVMSLLLIWRHKSNITSLLAGTEPRIGKQSAS